jgi:hypothetical protein
MYGTRNLYRKKVDEGNFNLFLGDSNNTQPIPLKCQLKKITVTEFQALQILSEIVLSGKLAFSDGLVEITDGKIISINKAGIR